MKKVIALLSVSICLTTMTSPTTGLAQSAGHGGDGQGTQNSQFTQAYHREWKQMYGRSEKDGVSIYTGNEMVFKNNARKFSGNPFFAESAKDFLAHLESESDKSRHRCIPKLTFAGHGWGDPEGGPGLPMGGFETGFYTDKASKKDKEYRTGWGPFGSSEARSLVDLKKLVKKKKIRFCSRCLIQIHSCNIAEDFGSELAKVSGCQVVTSAGQCAPISTFDGSLDHHWISGQDGSGIYSGFYRFTPTKDNVLWEKLGRRYIAQ